jgi:hypothetical protein
MPDEVQHSLRCKEPVQASIIGCFYWYIRNRILLCTKKVVFRRPPASPSHVPGRRLLGRICLPPCMPEKTGERLRDSGTNRGGDATCALQRRSETGSALPIHRRSRRGHNDHCACVRIYAATSSRMRLVCVRLSTVGPSAREQHCLRCLDLAATYAVPPATKT